MHCPPFFSLRPLFVHYLRAQTSEHFAFDACLMPQSFYQAGFASHRTCKIILITRRAQAHARLRGQQTRIHREKLQRRLYVLLPRQRIPTFLLVMLLMHLRLLLPQRPGHDRLGSKEKFALRIEVPLQTCDATNVVMPARLLVHLLRVGIEALLRESSTVNHLAGCQREAAGATVRR